MTYSVPRGAATETPGGDHHAVIAALQRTVAELETRVAQLEQPPARWLPLKVAAHDAGVKYETARQWAERGLIEARREGKRWLVNLISLKGHKERWDPARTVHQSHDSSGFPVESVPSGRIT